MHDENGNYALAPVQPPPGFRGSVGRIGGPLGFAGLTTALAATLHTGWLIAGAAAVAATVFSGALGAASLRVHLRWKGQQAALRRAAAAAFATAASPEAGLPEQRTMVRLRGRVRIVRPVLSPGDARSVGAFWVDGESSCGRFTLVGPAGVGIVDDDAFEVWGADAAGVPETLGAIVGEGDEVVVVGPGQRAPAGDAGAAVGAGGYRGTAEAIAFDGTAAEPVRIAVLPRAPG